MKAPIYQIASLLIALILLPAVSRAGTIRLEESLDIYFMGPNEDLRATGSYTVKNAGDEVAVDVSPTITIGRFSWTGEARRIDKGASEVWTVTGTITSEKLRCSEDPLCALDELPTRGTVPVFARVHYRDINGYGFSAPQLYRVDLVDGGATVPEPSMQAKLTIGGDGQEFEGTLEIRNASGLVKNVSVSYFTANEIIVETEPMVVKVSPQALATANFRAKNFRALPFSSYPVFAILQWEHDGHRGMTWTAATLSINEKNPWPWAMISMCMVGLFAAAFLVWWFVVRPSAADGGEAKRS